MTDYTKTTDFTSKDSLPSGDSGKIIRGAEFGTEFDNIQTAVNSKSNINNPAFTGNITVTGTVDGRDIAADGTKLDTIETSADVTDTANVTAAGAVMDSELTNIAAVKALNQGVATTDSPTFAAVTSTGNVTVGGTVDGRDVAADGTKLDTVETNADVTDTANVTAAGALMDSEVTNLDQVKAFSSADYATAAQGTTADNALPKTGGAMTGAITTNSTFDGRDVATDGTKLDGIEASADVTDTANVTAAGALMDSELTSIASVKALNQGVATTDSPTFAGVTANGTVEFDGLSGTGAVTVTDILDQDDMSGNSATALATQQSIKAYVDSQVGTVDTLAEVLSNGNATGGTDIAFGDNDKALFGAGSDLQIYHSGSHSFITDAGTGDLYIGASNNIALMNAAFSENKLLATTDGALKLYYDGSEKLATTSTGIDVTGTATMDGLTVDGDASVAGTIGVTADNGTITTGKDSASSRTHWSMNNPNGEVAKWDSNGTDLLHFITDEYKVYTAGNKAFEIDGNGDISFYEDTGTTPKLFWDASAESLGIGTSSPSAPLSFGANIPSNGQTLHTYHSGNIRSGLGIVSGVHRLFTDSGSALSFGQVSTSDGSTYAERMRIDTSGNLLVGTTDTTVYNNSANSTADNGFQVNPAGWMAISAYQQTPAFINRTGNDGSLISFTRSGTTVGSIGAFGGDLYIGTNDSGLRFEYAGLNAIVPFDVNSLAVSDAATDLGHENARFKDLHLSGTANVGGVTVAGSLGNLSLNTSGAEIHLSRNGNNDILANGGTSADLTVGANRTLKFKTGSSLTERARIDVSGNVLVSKSSLDVSEVGLELRADGLLAATRSGSNVAVFRRLSDDGSIVDFQKDGTTVGSIGVANGDLNINGDSGIRFQDTSIMPRRAGSDVDATVDIGLSSHRWKDLHLSGNISAGTGGSNSNNYEIKVSAGTSGLSRFIAADTAAAGYIDYDHSSNSWIHRTDSQERMRVDGSGNLLVGASSFSFSGSDDCVQVSGTEGRINIENDTTSTANVIAFYNPNGNVGRINTAGASTNYLTSSDQRLKENIVDAPSASDDIDAIQVRSFNWKVDGSHQKYGMVAQELNTVAPEAVSTPEDSEEMMGVDYSKLVPMLVKEIQSLRARVAQLETN